MPPAVATAALIAAAARALHEAGHQAVAEALLLFLAGAFFGIQIFVCMVFVFWPWANKEDMTEHLNTLKDLLTITFGLSITLLGSAIGFYFGRQHGE